ncbi:MAG: hypothetical protein J3K34DRAFT_5359 [Monoraphidium minutum]|nr:MAG: hypothetical protein J3K34DRAFT_5359 [Monoraphidium minutum]
MMHFLYEGAGQGWASTGFTSTPGAMYPADVVLGWVAGDGTAKVASYHLKEYDVTPSDEVTGWAYSMGVARDGGGTMVCFSRAVDAAAAKAVPKLKTDGTQPMIWASANAARLVQHNTFGSYTLDARPLLLAASGDRRRRRARGARARAAHGALMLIAFAALMPCGILMSRHKWLLGDAAAGRVRHFWFHSHVFLQALAILLAIASVVLIFAVFGAGRQRVHELYTPHMGLGLFAVAAAFVQALTGAFRPKISAPSRAGWRFLHSGWGYMAALAGIANVGLGICLQHHLQGDPVANWVAPAAVILGLLLVAAVPLELRRRQLVTAGTYDPSTHAFGNVESKRDEGSPAEKAELFSQAGMA